MTIVITLDHLQRSIVGSEGNNDNSPWLVAIIRAELHSEYNLNHSSKRSGHILQWHLTDDSNPNSKIVLKIFGKFMDDKLRYQVRIGSIVLLRRWRKLPGRAGQLVTVVENGQTDFVITADIVAQFYDGTWFALSPSHDPLVIQSIKTSKLIIDRVLDLLKYMKTHDDFISIMSFEKVISSKSTLDDIIKDVQHRYFAIPLYVSLDCIEKGLETVSACDENMQRVNLHMSGVCQLNVAAFELCSQLKQMAEENVPWVTVNGVGNSMIEKASGAKLTITVDSKIFIKCNIVGCNVGIKSNGIIKVLHLGPAASIAPDDNLVALIRSWMMKDSGIDFVEARKVSNWSICGYDVCNEQMIKQLVGNRNDMVAVSTSTNANVAESVVL